MTSNATACSTCGVPLHQPTQAPALTDSEKKDERLVTFFVVGGALLMIVTLVFSVFLPALSATREKGVDASVKAAPNAYAEVQSRHARGAARSFFFKIVSSESKDLITKLNGTA